MAGAGNAARGDRGLTGGIVLRAPRPGEADALTALCLRSKAWWGYDAAFMAACRAELTITEGMVATAPMRVGEVSDFLAGVVELSFEGDDAILEKLFVDPPFMGRGAGRVLLDWAVDTARMAGATRLVIDADPGAASFYRKAGAIDAGEAVSASIPGRMLPRLILYL